MIRVLIVDDHQVLIDGIRALLKNESNIDIRYQALNGEQTLAMVAEHREDIDLVLLDINLPDRNGFDICQVLKRTAPELKVLTLTMHEESGFIHKMVKAGTDGYVLKSAGKEELLSAIEMVMRGEKYFSKDVTNSLLESMQGKKQIRSTSMIQKITRREKEVLRLIMSEYTTEEIARELFISESTVISHRKSLLRKLNVKNTAGLVRVAMEFSLTD